MSGKRCIWGMSAGKFLACVAAVTGGDTLRLPRGSNLPPVPPPAAMCPSDLQQLWKEVSGVPSSEEALKQAEGLDLSTNSSNTTSAFSKAASAHIPLHSLANGQSHTPKRDR